MAFGERPYWDMSNHEVCARQENFIELKKKRPQSLKNPVILKRKNKQKKG